MNLTQGFSGQIATCVGRNFLHLKAQSPKNVTIGGIAGPGDRDPVAMVEQGEERQIEPRRRTARHRHAGGGNVNSVIGLVVIGDGLPEGIEAKRIGIADAALGRLGHGGVAHALRRRIGRLTHGERDDIDAGGARPIGGGKHVHGMEGFDQSGAMRDPQRVRVERPLARQL